MVKKMLINASHPEECRVAVVADGTLEELDVQIRTREATLGNIYKGVISRIEPSLQAVFVDYGAPRNGFLSINDVHPSYFPESFEQGRRRPRIQDVFKKDHHVIVQVNKEERGTKGASLTTNISLAGRYLVLMPGTDLCGVSRKIEDDEERKKLKEILKQITPPENMGFIVRTAGMGRNKTELSRDLNYLLKLWRAIEKNVGQQDAPALLHREQDVVIRSIREHFSQDISEILVDEKEAYKELRSFFHQVMPKYENLVKLSQEKRPLFNKYQLEEQIEQAYRRRIKLKSGGHIVIEPTEAMVTIDVNSGSATKEKGIEETAYRVNMEAAPEIARQLRLRDLGGIIVIDFIDMMHKKHKQDVEKTVRAELKKDRAKTKILRISTLGLLELSRQRLKSSLGTGEYLDCPLCDGRGKIRSPEMSAVSVFRRVKSLLIKGNVTEVRATVPAPVAEYLLNNMRSQLVELESQYSSRISIMVKQVVPDKEISVEAIKEEAPVVSSQAPSELSAAASRAAAEVPVRAVSVESVEVIQEEVREVVREVEQAADQETSSVLDADRKKAKRPGRRKRRRRRKIALETVPPYLLPDTGQDSSPDPEVNEEQAGLSFQERILSSLYGSLGSIDLDSTLQSGSEQVRSSPEDRADPGSEPVGSDEAPDSSDSEEAEQTDSDLKDVETKEEKRDYKKRGGRKASLQSFLPFS
ncbi:MAG: Rne/Rng family ribonuclease [Desulfomonilaceae bacterium]|nr:Rne/Rng family ribonuclease [Desulfomonilaceae bacterium]